MPEDQIQHAFDSNTMIQKYFEFTKDKKVICKHIPIYGTYARVFSEYQAIYEQLNLEIKDLRLLLIFQKAVSNRIKELQPDDKKGTNNVSVEGEDVLIGKQDFPDEYGKTLSHPDDYIRVEECMTPTIIYNDGEDKNERIIARFSWKSDDGKTYIPMSFICDTGATRHIFLSDAAFALLRVIRSIKKDELGTRYVVINGRKTALLPTPDSFQPANLIGLPLLSRFGLSIDKNKNVKFDDPPAFF